jgi:hypothetical protein
MTAKKTDAGQAEVQKTVDKLEDQGFLGTKVDPLPNSAHSLESGPDSPPAVPDSNSRIVHPTGEEN